MSTKCPECGNEIPAVPGFCAKCGWSSGAKPDMGDGKGKLPSGGRGRSGGMLDFCKGCGGRLEPGQKFCPECGTPAGGRKAVSIPKGAASDAVDGRKYDEAVRMGQEIEGQAVGWANFSGCLIDPVFGGLPLMIACFFWHELWWFLGIALVFGIAAMCCRAVVRGRLADHDVKGAKSALGPAKTCFWIAAAALGAGLLDVVIRLMALANK